MKYTDQEQKLNKVLKYNQDISEQIRRGRRKSVERKTADKNITTSEELLKSLGFGEEVTAAKLRAQENGRNRKLDHRPVVEDWEKIVSEAEQHVPVKVKLDDLLSEAEVNAVCKELNSIDAEFSQKTSIINKADLCFLAVATGLQVSKVLLFPYVADMAGYGQSFDPADRLAHDDKSIKDAHRAANDRFRNDKLKTHEAGYWINLLYQTPPYDITKGSAALGINMEGKYHRFHTLGHDPILGWLFGTANILTDIITLNDFRSFRVTRKPTMVITPQKVGIGTMIQESYLTVKSDYLSLPAAVFAQAQHFKSDAYTKMGLPVPVISAINESFASDLYKNQYDSLCFSRDTKIVGTSYAVSLIIDMIIGLVHGLFRQEEAPDLYEVRTRKILLISNSIASTSSVLNAYITNNPRNLDIGSLMSSLTHLLTDIRFMAKIKQEFIENRIYQAVKEELDEINNIYDTL